MVGNDNPLGRIPKQIAASCMPSMRVWMIKARLHGRRRGCSRESTVPHRAGGAAPTVIVRPQRGTKRAGALPPLSSRGHIECDTVLGPRAVLTETASGFHAVVPVV